MMTATTRIPPPSPRRSGRTESAAGMHMGSATHELSQQTAEACADCARVHGCKDCFEELVRRFQSPLLHFLTRRLSSQHDAEDLVQETFLTAYRSLGQYDSSSRFSTWVFTIANRLAISSRRGR